MSANKNSKLSDLTSSLFQDPEPAPVEIQARNAPLAVRMRPQTLDEVQGQDHILGEGKLLRRTIQSDRFTSLIFYGPPGCGKTTLARIIAKATKAFFVPINAVSSNIAELRAILDQAQRLKKLQNRKTLLFIDEIHRFNKAQQDILMPDVEEGIVILIGATTHNPSFVVNAPLLSRATIFELKPLEENHLMHLLERAIKDSERGLGSLLIKADEAALRHLALSASGDGRKALTSLEIGVLTTPPDSNNEIHFTKAIAEESCQRKIVYHDRDGDYHYDIASAFIKSMRGSDPDASIYWLAKMIYAGEDVRFIMRRILILASEDIGNADPQALILASAGLQAVEFVGLPEAQIILAQLVTYMALAPKSNASYRAIANASKSVKEETVREVPNHLRDSHSQGSKNMGYGKGYQYSHDFPGHYVEQEYMPDKASFYQPTQQGFEKILAERLRQLQNPQKS